MTPVSVTIEHLPNELLTLVLSPARLSLACIGTARTVCQRWADIGGAILAHQRRLMAAAAVRPGNPCAHQWSTIEVLTRALVDDSVPALLRVLDTGAVGPDDPIDTRGWNMLDVGAESTDLVHMFEEDAGRLAFESFVLYGDDISTALPPLVVTPLVMAFAYGAMNCARTLVALGARPMPHVDALVSFVIEHCAWRRQHVATVGTGPSSWAQPNVAIKSHRDLCVVSVLSFILESFDVPRPRRAPLGIVPPLQALVDAVWSACDRTTEALSDPDAANGVTDEQVVTQAVEVARLLIGAGYDPHASSRCHGPLVASRMHIANAGITATQRERRRIMEEMGSDTPCNNLVHLIDVILLRARTNVRALHALLDVYRAHTRDALP
nr:hypothetical protein [Pandoravirus massiliensis]